MNDATNSDTNHVDRQPPETQFTNAWLGLACCLLALVCAVLAVYHTGVSNDLVRSDFSHWTTWLWSKYANPPWPLILVACASAATALTARVLLRRRQ